MHGGELEIINRPAVVDNKNILDTSIKVVKINAGYYS